MRDTFMPTVWRELGFHFFFYSSDRKEPPHVHVKKDESEAKWWLGEPPQGAPREEWSRGFNGADRARIARIVAERREVLLEAWRKYFESR